MLTQIEQYLSATTQDATENYRLFADVAATLDNALNGAT